MGALLWICDKKWMNCVVLYERPYIVLSNMLILLSDLQLAGEDPVFIPWARL
jgi:hypothetical protein